MGIAKATISNNSYIGAFAIATDSYLLLTQNATKNEETLIAGNLGVPVVRCSIDGSDLIGVYAIANSNGILLPEIVDRAEVLAMKRHLPDVNISTISTSLNALRNNILANDRIAIVNREYSRAETKKIGDALGVEVIVRHIGGYDTIGANNILTNKGMVMNNSATDDDIAFVKRLGIEFSQSTANLGSSSIGLSVIANSKGLVVGDQTTGFEMARMSEGLQVD